MGYIPIRKLTKEEVQKKAREPNGEQYRNALVEAEMHDGPVSFFIKGNTLSVKAD